MIAQIISGARYSAGAQDPKAAKTWRQLGRSDAMVNVYAGSDIQGTHHCHILALHLTALYNYSCFINVVTLGRMLLFVMGWLLCWGSPMIVVPVDYLSFGPIEKNIMFFVTSACARRTGVASQASERMQDTLSHRLKT